MTLARNASSAIEQLVNEPEVQLIIGIAPSGKRFTLKSLDFWRLQGGLNVQDVAAPKSALYPSDQKCNETSPNIIPVSRAWLSLCSAETWSFCVSVITMVLHEDRGVEKEEHVLTAGVIGLGDMGSGLAKNLLKNGIKTSGFDLDPVRMKAFEAIGGLPQGSPREVGEAADAVFLMVMDGTQVKSVLFGENGLVQGMSNGKAIILTATIHPREASEIAELLAESGLAFIDSPVSGGFAGAQEGTLTMMAAAPESALDEFEPVMKAVSANIHRVGEEPGKGQQVKACLQSLIGAQFAATFEAAALAAKAGITGEVLHKVFSSSSAGCGIVNNALEKIIDREFEGTGSHINTMHKDLTISLKMAEELGVPVHLAAAAMQLFHAGRTKYPDGDNWVVTRIIEDIVGVELHR